MMGGADGLDSEVKDTPFRNAFRLLPSENKNGNNSTHRTRTNIKKIRGPFTLKVWVNIISTILPSHSPSQKIQDLKKLAGRNVCPVLDRHQDTSFNHVGFSTRVWKPKVRIHLLDLPRGAWEGGRKLLRSLMGSNQKNLAREITSWYETNLPIFTNLVKRWWSPDFWTINSISTKICIHVIKQLILEILSVKQPDFWTINSSFLGLHGFLPPQMPAKDSHCASSIVLAHHDGKVGV